MKKMRMILVTCLCFILTFIIYVPSAHGKLKTRHYYVTKTAYLYNSRSKFKKRIKKIDVNNKLSTSSSKSFKMYLVKYNGRKGYVYKSKLGAKPKSVKKYTNRSSYIYSSSKADKRPLIKISVDRKVTTQSPQSAKMSKVTYNGITGFIYNRNLSSRYVDYLRTYGTTQITRYDFSRIPEQQNNEQFKVPNFDSSKITNIPTAFKTANGTKTMLDVWDSWPLQNPNGTVAEYNGYHFVFALGGTPNDWGDASIYLFYQKVGETSISSWKNAGRVFEGTKETSLNDPFIKYQTQEWSGSAIKIGNEIRLFYTGFSGKQANGDGDFNQVLTTAKINVNVNSSDVTVTGIDDHKSIFNGDGKTYQNIEQFRTEGLLNSGDNHTLRDPHYVEDNGHKYLVFEGNTGTTNGYQEYRSLFNKAYYGGNDEYFNSSKNSLLARTDRDNVTKANAAIGIIELNDDYTLKSVMKPLVTANLVTDEIERPNVLKINGRWYLFAITKGYQQRVDGFPSDNTYMIGYVSDNLTGPYRPLNKTGLVIAGDENFNSRTYTYAYYGLLTEPGTNNLLITSYMTNRGISSNDHSTFAPSFLIQVNGDQTQTLQNSVLEQGQVTAGHNDSQSYSR